MNLESFLQQALSFAGTFHLTLVIILFVICAIGEFGVTIPYLLETIWLLSGYNVIAGALTPFQLFLLWVIAMGGRQVGAIILYFISRLGINWLLRLYEKYFKANLAEKLSGTNGAPLRLLRQINYLSPFSIAFARLLWLRIPLTITLGIKRQLKTLTLGILLSALVYDIIYIALGVVGGKTVLKPVQMVLYSLIGLTALYIITFIVRRVLKSRAASRA